MKYDNHRGHWVEHDPASNLDYGLNWLDWLAGDTIVSSNWAASDDLDLSQSEINGAVTSTYVTGGTVGNDYRLTNTVTTQAGRTGVRSLTLVCKAL